MEIEDILNLAFAASIPVLQLLDSSLLLLCHFKNKLAFLVNETVRYHKDHRDYLNKNNQQHQEHIFLFHWYTKCVYFFLLRKARELKDTATCSWAESPAISARCRATANTPTQSDPSLVKLL